MQLQNHSRNELTISQGSTVGPPTGEGLKRAFGGNNVAVEGIDYAAALSTNFLPGGADPAGIREMRDLFVDASAKCPNAVLVGGGYRYGANWIISRYSSNITPVKEQHLSIVPLRIFHRPSRIKLLASSLMVIPKIYKTEDKSPTSPGTRCSSSATPVMRCAWGR